MTQITKLLVVVVALGSLGFAGFAAALSTGGPNWEAIARSPEIGQQIAISRNDLGAWTANVRVTGEQVASSPNLAEVVIKSQQKILQDLRTQVQELQPRVEALVPQSEAIRKLLDVDRAGLQTQAELWSRQLQSLSDEIDRATVALTQKAQQNTRIQQELGERRFEVLRLTNQLELLRNDLFAAEAQRDALQKELILLDESRTRLERRQKQLKDQLGEKYEEQPLE